MRTIRQVLFGAALMLAFSASTSNTPLRTGSSITPRQLLQYGSLPMSFEVNVGQTDSQVKFLSRGRGYSLFLKHSGEAVLRVSTSGKTASETSSPVMLQMNLVGANMQPQVRGLEPLPGRVNYFFGNDSANWHTDIPTYATVEYEAVYPRVDLVYYGNQGQLEFDFVIAPGADLTTITLAFEGAEKLELDAHSNLVLHAGGQSIRLLSPTIYQSGDNGRQEIAGRFVLKGAGKVGFEVADYDGSKSLIIDPVLSYASYLGGNGDDVANDVAVDSVGNIYLTGATRSTNFPLSGALDSTLGGSSSGGPVDAYVVKLNAQGNQLLFATYLGGSVGGNGGQDFGDSISVDNIGNIYVAGDTDSTNFPTTAGTVRQQPAGGFLSKLTPTGNALIFSTYIGGGIDAVTDMALDSFGHAYLTGLTTSTVFPTTPGAFQTTYGGGGSDAFVTAVRSDGASYLYSTYLGGSNNPSNDPGDSHGDGGSGIALDASGNAYVAGRTQSLNFPTTAGVVQPVHRGATCDTSACTDIFVAKLNQTGSSLIYSTFLGGTFNDSASSINVDISGNAFVTGGTDSIDFPTTVGAFQRTFGASNKAFVTKLNPTATALVFSTFLGGSNHQFGQDLALDSAGNVVVTGHTDSTDFPTLNAFRASLNGTQDIFLAKLNAAGSGLVYSTYFGGSTSTTTGVEAGLAVTIDGQDNVYISGNTESLDFPTMNPFQVQFGGPTTGLGGLGDGFISKIGSDIAVNVSTLSGTVKAGQPATYTVTVSPPDGTFTAPVSFACSGLPAKASCSFSPGTVTPGVTSATTSLTISTTANSVVQMPPAGLLGLPPLYAFSIILAALVLLTLGLRFQPWRLPLALTVAVVCLSCSGGGTSGSSGGTGSNSSGGNSGGTPQGTYTVTVTATSGTLQRTTAVTLTVQQ